MQVSRMYAVALFFLLLSTTISSGKILASTHYPVVAGYQGGYKCPNWRFLNNCKRCFCEMSGTSAVCGIIQKPEDPDFFLPVFDWKHHGKCPAQAFINNCMLCTCTRSGFHALCTYQSFPPASGTLYNEN